MLFLLESNLVEPISYYQIIEIGMKPFPSMFYGTAWKKQHTADLVTKALKTGFRAIDTACQPKHYNEPGVGQGIQESGVPRDQLFIQTKFTSLNGQDPTNIPYNPKDNLQTQVKTSLQVSLSNLKTTYLDSLVLHSPMSTLQKTLEVWSTFESFVHSGKVHHLGLSNCYNYAFFVEFYDKVKIKPSVLQNRFYKESGYDLKLREFCMKNKIKYQSFWTLTGNPQILHSKEMNELSLKYKKTPEQLFYSILIHEGIIVLNGTTSEAHMKSDLLAIDLQIEQADRNKVMALCR